MAHKMFKEFIGDVGVVEKKDIFGNVVTGVCALLVIFLIFLGVMAYIAA